MLMMISYDTQYYEFTNQSMDYFVYNYAEVDELTPYNHAQKFRVKKDLTTKLLMQMASGGRANTSNEFYLNDEAYGDSYVIKPIRMLNTLYKTLDLDIKMDFSKPLNKETRQEQYYLTPNFPSPFSETESDELRTYFHSLVEMKLDFEFRTIFIKREFPEVLLWTVSLTYDFRDRGGRVPLLAKFDVSLCLSNRQRVTLSNVALSAITWVCIIVILLSCVSIFLVLRAVIRSFRLVRKAKKDTTLKYYSTYGSFPEDQKKQSFVPNHPSMHPSMHPSQMNSFSMGNNLVGVNTPPESIDPMNNGNTEVRDGSEISIPMSVVEVNPTLRQRMKFFNVWYVFH